MDIKVWGNNIWYLFHTIAYKIKEDEFNNIKQDLFYIVKTICQNLPCPECSEHATNLRGFLVVHAFHTFFVIHSEKNVWPDIKVNDDEL